MARQERRVFYGEDKIIHFYSLFVLTSIMSLDITIVKKQDKPTRREDMVGKRREVRRNEKTGNLEYVEYSTSSGRLLRVLMKGFSHTTRKDMDQMIIGYEGCKT